jgi:four helix bundle protein
MHRFKDLEIWKQSRTFCSEIYTATTSFPSDEKFGLTNQLRRASVSIPSNIAEGCSRSSNKDFSRFLEIATQLLIAYDLGFIPNEVSENLTHKLDNIVKMISKFRSILTI